MLIGQVPVNLNGQRDDFEGLAQRCDTDSDGFEGSSSCIEVSLILLPDLSSFANIFRNRLDQKYIQQSHSAVAF